MPTIKWRFLMNWWWAFFCAVFPSWRQTHYSFNLALRASFSQMTNTAISPLIQPGCRFSNSANRQRAVKQSVGARKQWWEMAHGCNILRCFLSFIMEPRPVFNRDISNGSLELKWSLYVKKKETSYTFAGCLEGKKDHFIVHISWILLDSS